MPQRNKRENGKRKKIMKKIEREKYDGIVGKIRKQ